MAYDDALEDDERDLNAGRDDHDEDDDAEDRDDDRGQDEGRDGSDDDAGGEDDDRGEESAEERRRARSEQRKRDKERRQQARERDRHLIQQQARELAELRAAVNGIAQRTDMGQLEGQLSQAQDAYQQTRKALRDAVEGGDVEQQVKLMEDVAVARRRVEDLSAVKERVSQPPKPKAPNAAEIRTQAYYDSFVKNNRWFDPSGRDNDSAAAIQISNEVAAAGIPAHDPEHWLEIDRRVREKLPHRFGAKTAAATARQPARSPVGGGTRSAQAGGNADETRIPREYREMLEQSGDWADPKRRKAMIDEYKASAKRHGV